MSKYINPFTDVGFKKIFGQEINKDLLIDFLNSLLKGERVINNVTFLNFQQEGISEKFRTDIALLDMQTKQPFSDKIRLIYLQLPLFTKEVSECENQFERWIYVLKNMEKLNRYPFEIKDKVFKKLIETCDVASWTREERIKYDRALKHFRDTIAVMEGQKQEGIKEGRAEGIKEGKEQGRKEERMAIAQNMKAKGIDASLISETTGLSVTSIGLQEKRG